MKQAVIPGFYNKSNLTLFRVDKGGMSSIVTSLGRDEKTGEYIYINTPVFYGNEPPFTVSDLKDIKHTDIEYIYIYTLGGEWEYCDLLLASTWDNKNYSRRKLPDSFYTGKQNITE